MQMQIYFMKVCGIWGSMRGERIGFTKILNQIGVMMMVSFQTLISQYKILPALERVHGTGVGVVVSKIIFVWVRC